MHDDAPPPSVTMTDVLALPDQQCRLVTWLMRQGEAKLDAIAGFLDTDDASARDIVADLARRGFVSAAGPGTTVAARVAEQRKRRAPSSIWDALDCSAGRREDI